MDGVPSVNATHEQIRFYETDNREAVKSPSEDFLYVKRVVRRSACACLSQDSDLEMAP